VPDEPSIGPEAGSLMAHLTGVSGLIFGSRFEAPDVRPMSCRLCQKTTASACLRSGGAYVRYQLLPMCPECTLKHMARRSGLEPPTTWFEVTPTSSTFQLEQSLATLAAFAKPT